MQVKSMAKPEERRRTYRRTEDLYRKSVEDVRDYAIFMTDREGRVVNWNRGAEYILGYSEIEAIGKDAAIFFTPEDRANNVPELEMTQAATVGRAEDERWHVRRDNTRFWASGILSPVQDESGALLGFTKVMRDLTEKKRLEAERDSFFTLSIDLLCIVRLDGHFQRVNPAFWKVLGYSEDELLSSSLFDFLHPEDRLSTELEYEGLKRGEPTIFMENRFRGKDGSYKWLAWSYFPVPEEGLAYGVGRDTTQLRQMHEDLRNRAEDLEKANREKDEFLAILSHELRTPLTSILGWSRLLRRGHLEEGDRTRAVDIIERNAEAQARLIEDLLDISRIITGKLKMDLQPLPLAPIVENVVNELRPSAEAKKLSLKVTTDENPVPIMGDPTRLQQIITNLVSNAIKFTPEGGRVEVSMDKNESEVRVRVSDTGIGINPSVLPFIFERFKQADSTDVRTHSGLGLGLAIVNHLVAQHGGSVTAESEGQGLGSVFTVTIPLAASNQIVSSSARVELFSPQVRAALAHGLPVNMQTPQNLNGVRVLLVEDETDTRELLTTILERCGAQVTATTSAMGAMSTIETMLPDVLISDIAMPGANGYELIQQIRSKPPQHGGLVPAIALTAHAGAVDRRRALVAGFNVHLAKPVEPDELLAVIAGLLNHKKTADQSFSEAQSPA